MKIALIEARTDLGVDVDGTNLGPKILGEYFKENEKISKLVCVEKNNIEKSQLESNLRKNIDDVNRFNEQLYKEIISIKNDNDFPITLGGDHSLAIASSLGSIKTDKNLGIIWVDAHLDYNTFETTITGNLHGLPLAAINGLNKDLSKFHNSNYYNPKNTVVVGYRADEENKELELNNIKEMGVTVFTTDDIKKLGVKEVMNKAISIASNNTNGIHLSYDLDVIDPVFAPGVSVGEDNGINLEEAFLILDEIINNKDLIKSIDLVEYNPLNDKGDLTKKIAIDIIEKVIKNLT